MSTTAQYDQIIARQIVPLLHSDQGLSQYGQHLVRQPPDPFIMVNRDPANSLARDIEAVKKIYMALSDIPLGSVKKTERLLSIKLRGELTVARKRLDMTLTLMINLTDRRAKKVAASEEHLLQTITYIEAAEYFLSKNTNAVLTHALQNLQQWKEQYSNTVSLGRADVDTAYMTIEAVKYFCTERLTLWDSMLNTVDEGNRKIAEAIKKERVVWAR